MEYPKRLTGSSLNMTRDIYDWVVVGGGVAGIALGEMLARINQKVLIVERNETLAAETSCVFHEWLHTGTLYTLAPDKLTTTRYLLGAIDDLLEYYSCFSAMNLKASESGLKVEKQPEDHWFNPENIFYKYKSRPLNPLWNLMVARSITLINNIDTHDWLRRRAGSTYSSRSYSGLKKLRDYPLSVDGFREIKSPDVTINSRKLLFDLLTAFKNADGEVKTNFEVQQIVEHDTCVELKTSSNSVFGKHAVICAADGLSKFSDTKVRVSYAPMLVVGGLDSNAKSFVELDYHIKTCINLLVKEGGYGLAGGISVSRPKQIEPYMNYCIDRHKKCNPNIEIIGTYVGQKKELVGRNQQRNYLYHINQETEKVWSVILGKFSLFSSLAPEFIRRITGDNPPRWNSGTDEANSKIQQMLSPPMWKIVVQAKD